MFQGRPGNACVDLGHCEDSLRRAHPVTAINHECLPGVELHSAGLIERMLTDCYLTLVTLPRLGTFPVEDR